MRRFVAVCSIFIGVAALGCSSAPNEKVASTRSAQTGCESATVVTLTAFDPHTLVLTGVTADGVELAIQYTSDTIGLLADLGTYTPPDPCFGQATAWNNQIDQIDEIDVGCSRALVQRLEHFARFDCAASITLGADDEALTFQPVASASSAQ
jgi:hypothetical protein